MRARYFMFVSVVSLLGACAGENSDTSPGGGGEGGNPVEGGGGNGGEVSTGGQGGTVDGGGDQGGEGGEGGAPLGCPQDCSTVEVPVCYVATCNEDTHTCEIGPAEDGAACEDGEYCTVDDTCMAGSCESGGPRDCTGGTGDECTESACDEDADTCSAAPIANGTPCTSADPCLSNTACFNGTCQGAPMDCSATPLDSPECQAAECDPATGACAIVAINDGVPCTYGDICETDKQCDMGECIGTAIPDCTGCTEAEANNTYSTANTGTGCASWAGGITVVGDKDCFAVDVTTAGSRILAQVTDVNGQGCPSGFDSVIRLFNSAGTELASDDQGAPGSDGCSMFLPTNTGSTNLAVGTYYVCVEDFLNNGTSPPYLLLMSAAAPGCGNQIKEGTEQCDSTELGGATCVSQGFAAGTLSCDASCAFDTSQCVAAGCGNNLLEFGEDCEVGAGCSATCNAFTCAAGEVPFSVTSTEVPGTIPDPGTFSSHLTVPTTGTITAVGVQIRVTHGYDADLDITLTPPASGPVDLTSDNGDVNDNFYNTVFSPTATTAISAGTAPFTGLYLPEGSLTAMYGTAANGVWTLNVTDDDAIIAGTLDAWRVFGCIQP
ncbi:MAG: hypothetical protein HOW73_42730 [Polyangiaceae bacterium]|nr:hypothetical protein [Polyangiaceae bacterium]